MFKNTSLRAEGEAIQKYREGFNPELFFEALGIEPDWKKIRYYILLDELF